MAKFAKMSYAQMIQAILDAAEQRLQNTPVSDVLVCNEKNRTVKPKTAFSRG
jgi:hypothetical protein